MQMDNQSENNQTYIRMMMDSLVRKESVLRILYELTERQTALLAADELDVDAFADVLDEKGERIEELGRLDDGFDSLYQKVEEVLLRDRYHFRSEIEQMKRSVAAITDYSSRIQVIEKRNRDRFASYIKDRKKDVRQANLNQKSISSYSQNMAGGNRTGNSFYFNEMK